MLALELQDAETENLKCHYIQGTLSVRLELLTSIASHTLYKDIAWPWSIITPPTSCSQSRRSFDVTWRHTMSPKYTQRQKSVTGIHWKCLLSAKYRFRCDEFVIRPVTDVLRTNSRFVKCVGGSPPPPPHTHANFTILLWARSTSVTDLITNKVMHRIQLRNHIQWSC